MTTPTRLCTVEAPHRESTTLWKTSLSRKDVPTVAKTSMMCSNDGRSLSHTTPTETISGRFISVRQIWIFAPQELWKNKSRSWIVGKLSTDWKNLRKDNTFGSSNEMKRVAQRWTNWNRRSNLWTEYAYSCGKMTCTVFDEEQQFSYKSLFLIEGYQFHNETRIFILKIYILRWIFRNKNLTLDEGRRIL